MVAYAMNIKPLDSGILCMWPVCPPVRQSCLGVPEATDPRFMRLFCSGLFDFLRPMDFPHKPLETQRNPTQTPWIPTEIPSNSSQSPKVPYSKPATLGSQGPPQSRIWAKPCNNLTKTQTDPTECLTTPRQTLTNPTKIANIGQTKANPNTLTSIRAYQNPIKTLKKIHPNPKNGPTLRQIPIKPQQTQTTPSKRPHKP